MFYNPRNLGYGFYQPRNIFYDDFNSPFQSKARQSAPRPQKAKPIRANQPLTAQDIKIKIDAEQNTLTIFYRQKNGEIYSESKKLPEYVKRDQSFSQIKCQLENGEVKILLPKKKASTMKNSTGNRHITNLQKPTYPPKKVLYRQDPNPTEKDEYQIAAEKEWEEGVAKLRARLQKQKQEEEQQRAKKLAELSKKPNAEEFQSKVFRPKPSHHQKSSLDKINEQNESEFILMENTDGVVQPVQVDSISEISIEDDDFDDQEGEEKISNCSEDLELVSVTTIVE